MATKQNHTGIFKKVLVEFIGQEDPLLAMLKWTAQQMMQIEAEGIVGAQEGRIYSIFHLRAETLRTCFDRMNPRSFYKWCFHTEDRTPGEFSMSHL